MSKWNELQHYLAQGFYFKLSPNGEVEVGIDYMNTQLVEVYKGDNFDHACLSCEAWVQLNTEESNA